jgi:hypothetical protein
LRLADQKAKKRGPRSGTSRHDPITVVTLHNRIHTVFNYHQSESNTSAAVLCDANSGLLRLCALACLILRFFPSLLFLGPIIVGIELLRSSYCCCSVGLCTCTESWLYAATLRFFTIPSPCRYVHMLHSMHATPSVRAFAFAPLPQMLWVLVGNFSFQPARSCTHVAG